MSPTTLRKRVIYGSAFASVFITVLTLGLDLIFGMYKDGLVTLTLIYIIIKH